MAIINTNVMTIAGTHGASTVASTKIISKAGGYKFLSPYRLQLKYNITFFIQNGYVDWDDENALNIEGITTNNKAFIIDYDGVTDGDLFLYIDRKAIEYILSIMPSLDPEKLVSEFEPPVE